MAIKDHRKVFLQWGCRVLLSSVFFYGGITKIGKTWEFAEIIGAYGILPEALLYPVAFLLPPVEIVVAVGLICRFRWAVSAITALLCIFMVVIVYGISLGLDIDCGCFEVGALEYQMFKGLKGALVRDLFLLLPLYCVYVGNAKIKKGRVRNDEE